MKTIDHHGYGSGHSSFVRFIMVIVYVKTKHDDCKHFSLVVRKVRS